MEVLRLWWTSEEKYDLLFWLLSKTKKKFSPPPLHWCVPMVRNKGHQHFKHVKTSKWKILCLWVRLCTYGTFLVILAFDITILDFFTLTFKHWCQCWTHSKLQVLFWCSAAFSRAFWHFDCRGLNQSSEWLPSRQPIHLRRRPSENDINVLLSRWLKSWPLV